MFTRSILLKRNVRSDTIWTNGLIYKSFLKRIPLYLDTMALLKSQYWPRVRTERLAHQRLALLIRDAATIPMWRGIFNRSGINPESFSFGDLSRLPVISKQDYATANYAYTMDRKLRPSSSGDHTSGSTGRPFHFYLDQGTELRLSALCERMLRTAGRGKRFPVISLRVRPKIGLTFLRHSMFRVRNYDEVRSRTGELAQLINRFREGCILEGFTSFILEAARCAQEAHMVLPIRAVIATGEEVTPGNRSLIERTLRASFFMSYASREIGFLAFECEEHRLHVNEESLLIEILDASDNPCRRGEEGRIVVTAFDHRVMPFIRYSMGDRGIMDEDPCPCGRTLRTIRIKGREAHLIEMPNGRTVPVIEIASIFDGFFSAVQHYRIEHTAPLTFMINIVPRKGFLQKRPRLHKMILGALHPTVQINWRVVPEIPAGPGGKAQYFIKTF